MCGPGLWSKHRPNAPGGPEKRAFEAAWLGNGQITLSVNLRKTYSYGGIVDWASDPDSDFRIL
jgi:hypothetical protein